MKKILILTIIILTIYLFSCNSIEPPSGLTINLTLEDASCTEAWITLSSNLRLPATVELKQNNQTIKTINLTKPDSLLFIDSLLPNTSYTFQASNSAYRVTSNQLQLATLDTTSHNFTWQTWTFGEHSSSVLYDVAIINENSIYAVGEIYMNDTLGQPDPTPYNAIHWNGTSWDTMRIPTKTFSGTTVSSVIKTIFSFNENDIWTFSIAGSYSHWNGSNWETEFVIERDGSGSKFWGISSSRMYLVCNNGGITYYDGTNWQKLESGTELNINDIWGDYNENASEWEILIVGGNIFQSTERIILKINNANQVQQISPDGTIEYPLSSVWFKSNIEYYVSGDGIYSSINLNNYWQNLNLPNYYGFSIRGAGLNDIVVCGGAGYVGHFNGYSWKNYLDGELQEITGNYYSTAIKGNTIAAVGNTAEGKAIAVIGKR